MRIKTEREKQREEDKHARYEELNQSEKDFCIALGNLPAEIRKMVLDEYEKTVLDRRGRGFEESTDNQNPLLNDEGGSSCNFHQPSETSAKKEEKTSQDTGEKFD